MTRPRPSLLAVFLILAGATSFSIGRKPARLAAQANQAATRDEAL